MAREADATFRTSIDTRDLREDLESVKLGLGREVGRLLQDSISPIVRLAAGLAPYDPMHSATRKDGLPHLRDTIAAGGASPAGATVVSTHPAAAVYEWNDDARPSIAPRGVPLTLKSVQMAHKAAEQQLPEVERRVADGIDALLARYGL